MPNENIIEIGPASSPAREFYKRFTQPIITFIGADGEKSKFDYAHEFPGSEYFAVGFLHYIKTMAAGRKVDYVIASNVLNLAYERIDASRLAIAAKSILKPGGQLIVENTIDRNGENMMRSYEQDIVREGYKVVTHFVNRGPVPEDMRSKFVNTHVIDANGRGFSIHATKP